MGKSNVHFELDADSAKAVRGFLRIVDAQNKATTGAKKFGREGQASGKKLDGALAGIASRFLGVAAVIGGVTRGISTASGEIEQAAQRLKQQYESLKTLVQVADVDKPGDLGTLKERVRKLRAVGFTPEMGTQLVYGARSNQALGDETVPMFGRMLPFIKDPNQIAESVGVVRGFFGEQAGTAEDVTNKLLAASRISAVEPEKMAAPMARAMGSWKKAGWHPDTLFAAMSKLAQKGTEARTATALGQFAFYSQKALRSGTARDFEEALATWEAMPEGKREKVLQQSKELGDVYSQMALHGGAIISENLPQIKRAAALSGTNKSEIERRRAYAMADPELSAIYRSKVSEQLAQMAEEPLGYRWAASRDIIRDRWSEDLRNDVAPVTALMRRGRAEAANAVSTFFGYNNTPALAERLSSGPLSDMPYEMAGKAAAGAERQIPWWGDSSATGSSRYGYDRSEPPEYGEKMLQAIEAQTKVLEEMRDQAPQNAALGMD